MLKYFFYKVVIFFYCKEKHTDPLIFLKGRTRFIKNMSLMSRFKDRIKFIYHMAQNVFYHQLKVQTEDDVYFWNTVINCEKNKEAKSLLKSRSLKSEPFTLVKSYKVVKSFRFYSQAIANFFFSFLSLLDYGKYELYPLHHFFRLRSAIHFQSPKEIHLFSTYYLPFYLFINSNFGKSQLFVYMGNAPLNFVYKYGTYVNLTMVLSNVSQEKELQALIERGDIDLKYSVAVVGSNTNIDKMKGFSKTVKYRLGFFSEGWWQRNLTNGFSIEDPKSLREHLKSPFTNRASVEIKLFNYIYEYARKNRISFSLYLHPCEERALKNGFIPPYLEKIDDSICQLGTKESGVSNFYEVEIGITALPSASIVTDRSSEGLKTLFLSNQMLDKHNINHDAEKLYTDVNEIEITSFEDLELKISKLGK